MATSNNYMKEYEDLMEGLEDVKKKLTSAETTRDLLKESYLEEKKLLEEDYGVTFSSVKELNAVKESTEKDVKDILQHMRDKLENIDAGNGIDLDGLDDDLIDLD